MHLDGCAWTIQDDGISSTINDIGLLPGRGIAFLTFLDGSWRVRLAPAEPGSDIVDLMGGGTDLLVDDDVVTPALDLRIQQSVGRGMDIGPDGSIYVNDHGGHKVVKLANGAPGIYGAATIPSEDGSELYEFDDRGRHLRTLNGLTNDVVWSFHYDAQGRLIRVEVADGDPTTIVRNPAGEPTAIRSRAGIVTLGPDERGYLDEIVYPTGAVYAFVNRKDGIMTSMTTPRQLVHEFSYDSLGRLERAEAPDAEDGSQSLVRTSINEDAYQVEHQTALERTTTYRVSRSVASERTRTQTHPDGSTSTQAELASEITRTTSRDGTVIETQSGPDPRLGHLASVPERTIVTTPSGLAGVFTTAVSFIPAVGQNPLAADEVIREVAVQQDLNRTHTMRYRAADGATPAEVLRRSPENRSVLAVLGLHGRVDRVRLGTWSDGAFSASTFHDLVFGYDPRGRLTTVTQGSDISARTMTYHYDENGFVDQVTDPASQTHEFDYDDAGRPTTVTLPGGQIIGLAYDADGNLSGVTPPGQPQHTLAHNGVDDLERYTPPDVLPGDDATQYNYDDDHALIDILRPDGRSVSFGYGDDTGRLDSVLTDSRNIELAYWPGTGQFRSFTEANGGTTEYRWDGPLLRGVQRTGSFAGEVTRIYGADFRLESETVAGASTTSYDYDDDDLLIGAGAESISRHPVSGAISGTVLDEVSSTITYSDFGEPASLAYSHGARAHHAPVCGHLPTTGRTRPH